MDSKLTKTKLNDENYFNWKFRMEMFLRKEGVWIAISTDKPAVTSTLTSSNSTAIAKWEEADEKARSWIGLSVEEGQLGHIRNQKTAKESWKALKTYHEKSTLVNKTTIMRNLCGMKLSESKEPTVHIESMTNLFQKLVNLGEKDLSERWKTVILLSSLPATYNTLITALEARSDDDLSFDLVQSKIQDDFMRRNTTSEKEAEDEKLLKIGKAQSKPGEKEKKFCYFCKT